MAARDPGLVRWRCHLGELEVHHHVALERLCARSFKINDMLSIQSLIMQAVEEHEQ